MITLGMQLLANVVLGGAGRSKMGVQYGSKIDWQSVGIQSHSKPFCTTSSLIGQFVILAAPALNDAMSAVTVEVGIVPKAYGSLFVLLEASTAEGRTDQSPGGTVYVSFQVTVTGTSHSPSPGGETQMLWPTRASRLSQLLWMTGFQDNSRTMEKDLFERMSLQVWFAVTFWSVHESPMQTEPPITKPSHL
jgi:hypothetical protein